MYASLQMGLKYLRYYLSAYNSKGHGMHAPFTYTFITEVLNDDRNFYAYRSIENLRQLMLHNPHLSAGGDTNTGAGSLKKTTASKEGMARYVLPSRKISQLLFRISDHYAPQKILEIGTSLGIATASLAAAGKDTKLVTLEQTSTVADRAMRNFEKLGLSNIECIKGVPDQTLPPVLAQLQNPDLVFINGDHGYSAMKRYFCQLLPHLSAGSILVVDSIHRSREMEQAWHEIKEQAAVTLSIDLFYIGLVFFRKEQKVKQHFTIRF